MAERELRMAGGSGFAAPTGLAAGIVFMALATFFFPSMDAIAKALTGRYDSVQVTWARYASQCVLVFLLFAPRLTDVARTERLGLHLLRSSFLLGATFFFFTALSGMELADTTAVMFAAPLIVTALAGPLLGERIGVWRWSAVAIGFCGMLLLVRPGSDGSLTYALIAVAAAVCYALYQISTRWMSGHERPETMLFYTALVGTFVLSCAAPFFWTTPNWGDVGLMIVTGMLGTLGQVSMILAFRAAQASVLTPFSYLSLIWALLWGVLFFNTAPDRITFIGVAIVVLAGLVILWRERVRGSVS